MALAIVDTVNEEYSPIAAVMPAATPRDLNRVELQHHAQAPQLALGQPFSPAIIAADPLDTLLQHALAHAMTLVPAADCGAIYLTDESRGHLVLHASRGFNLVPACTLPLAGAGSTLFCHHWYIADSTDELTLLLALDVNAHQHLLDAFALAALPSGIAVIPLVAESDILGVVILMRLNGAGRFVEHGGAGLASFATMTAAAVRQMQPARVITMPSTSSADSDVPSRAFAAQSQPMRAAMRHTARMATVGHMTVTMMHEITNPLWAVQSALELMRSVAPDDLRYAQLMQLARDELARVTGITTRMRDFSRSPHQELMPCDLNYVLQETLAVAELQLRHTRITVTCIPAAERPMVKANDTLLRQVFLNLILNAIDAMPAGGTLAVRVIPRACNVLVEVQDTGVGISADIRPHLFQPFVTSKPNGTGLGLAMSAHILAEYAGTITLEDNPDQGCTCRVVLPCETRG